MLVLLHMLSIPAMAVTIADERPPVPAFSVTSHRLVSTIPEGLHSGKNSVSYDFEPDHDQNPKKNALVPPDTGIYDLSARKLSETQAYIFLVQDWIPIRQGAIRH